MDTQEELERLLGEVIDSVKTTILTLEAAAPLLGQRHRVFQAEATRLIGAMRRIEDGALGLLDAGEVDSEYEALISLAATQVVQCAICGGTVQAGGQTIPTTTGGWVHIACADQQAALVQARRRRWALVHGVIFACVVIALCLIAGITPWLLALTVVGLTIHIVMHHRWWYYLRRDVGTWLLLGARKW